MQVAIIITLILVLGVGCVMLMLDARQRRIDRHVEKVLPASQAAGFRSVRRQQVESRWRLFHRVIDYRTGLAYDWRPEFVAVAGALAATSVVYANTFLGLSLSHVVTIAATAALLVARGLFGWQRRRLANQLRRQLPDAIELVTSTVRSGLPASETFRIIARDMPQPTAGQFAVVCSEMALGRSAEEALDAVYRRTDVAEYGMFAVTLGVQTKSGGRLTETLQTLGDTVRERVALAARAKAMAGEVIFSSRALSVSPLVVGGIMYLINPQMVDLLFSDPIGKTLLAYAVGSVIAGTLVIRWMIRRGTAL